VAKIDIDALIEGAKYTGPTITADQLIGLGACLTQLAGQLALLRRPDLGERFGLRPSGTLFIGAPGTGKTHLARYLAGALERPLYQVSADQFEGEPAAIHELFARLGSEPAILFVDEISILAQKRESWGVDSADRRILAALLTALDGLQTAANADRLWVIGACTPDIALDPAIYRSGRLGVTIEFAPPSEEQRRALFRLYLADVPHRITSGHLGRLARASAGATGADIADWINQAASLVLAEASDRDPVIRPRHLNTVVARRGFVAADERPGRGVDWEDCLHEAAHAVAALTLFGEAALGEVSVGVGRSENGYHRGQFVFSDTWTAANPPNSNTWRDHVVSMLVGVCAEELILGYRGSGASTDLHNATQLVIDQSFETGDPLWGPSRLTVEGSSRGHGVVGSESMRRQAWFLTRRRFDECWIKAERLVDAHRAEIEHLAGFLLRAPSMLIGHQIASVIEGTPSANGAGGEGIAQISGEAA
jgi:cell division protease FtsH